MAIRYQSKAGTIELPKLTMALSEMSDEVEVAEGTRERFGKMYDFLREVVDADALAVILDGDSLDSIDLVALGVTFSGVIDAYAAPLVEEQKRQLNSQLAAARPALDAMGKIQAAQGRQGFKAVK